jgi:hypothetical protein
MKAQGPPDAAPENGGTHPSSRDSAAITCAGSSKAQGPPDAAPENGGTHPSSRDSAAITCAGSSKAQGPPDAAPENGGTHPSSRDSAAITCAGSSKDWLDVIDREYLSDFIPEGGGSVKFLAGAPEQNAEVSAALDVLADSKGFVRVDLDAAGTRLHRIDHIFFEIARQIDWAGLAAVYIAQRLREPGWSLAKSPDGFDLAAMALENGVEEAAVRQTLKGSLAALWADYSMTQEFRLAMIQICLAQVAGLEHAAIPAIYWLRGALSRISELKGAKIFAKIGRHNARLMLQSLANWMRRNGQPGLILALDISRALENVKRADRGEGFYYSSAALTELYETLRQLIDGCSETPGVLVVVFAPPELLSDEKRGVDRYQALKMRIFDDVRNRGIENPLAPLVRLNQSAEAA